MIIFDVLTWECPVGDKGERYRLFLCEEGYAKAIASENRREMKIIRRANVYKGDIFYEQS